MKKILFIFGTRPEAIKMVPIYKKFKDSKLFKIKLCVTAQHRQMLDDVLDFFEITADYDLNIMKENQSLESLTAKLLLSISSVLDKVKPDFVCVHGDTTTSFVASLSAFYKKIDVWHIEAGLRTNDSYSPFPEEMNRQLTSKITKIHFAPTIKAKENLLNENIDSDNIFVVGNSVIDALMLTLNMIKEKKIQDDLLKKINYQFNNRKIILITGHRRENFGNGFLNICKAIKELALKYKDIDFIYPVHLNPNVRNPVFKILKNTNNIFLLEPLGYVSFVYLMGKSHLILTDSGGIQEEAPSLGKPVLVMRENTERQEAVEEGVVKLVGTDINIIVERVSSLLDNKEEYNKMSQAKNPYGTGDTGKKILEVIKKRYYEK